MIWQRLEIVPAALDGKRYSKCKNVDFIFGEWYIVMNFYLFGLIILPVFLWFTDNILTFSLKKYGSISRLIMFIIGLLIFRMPFSDEFLVFIFLILILEFSNNFKSYKFKIR